MICQNVAFFPTIFNNKMATEKFTNFDKLFKKMYADMTAVTMWCNKIVSNEVRQINTTGAILQKGKKDLLFGQPNR